MLRAERAKIFLPWCTIMVHKYDQLAFDIKLTRLLGGGFARKLPKSCFACRTNVWLHGGCPCGTMFSRSCDRADIGE